MIVRPDGDRLLLVTQPDHAALSGRIMAAWRGDDLSASPTRETVLRATREHDCGWLEVDDRPALDAAGGSPQDFMTAPDATKQGVWPRGVRRLEPIDPGAAALVAQHALALAERHPVPGWERFHSDMTAERDRILRRGAYRNDLDALRADYRFVFLGDLISLVFCCAWSETFDYEGWTVTRDGTAVQVQPDPFEGATIELTAPARRLAGAALRVAERPRGRVRRGAAHRAPRGRPRPLAPPDPSHGAVSGPSPHRPRTSRLGTHCVPFYGASS